MKKVDFRWLIQGGILCILAFALSHTGSALADGLKRDVPTSAKQLQLRGFEPTAEGISRALTNEFPWTVVYAIRTIRDQNTGSFAPELTKLLTHERARVRVEAAQALATLGDSHGEAAIREEVKKGSETVAKLKQAHVAPGYWTSDDLKAWVEAAGMLVKDGDPRGFNLVKAAVENEKLGAQVQAARILSEFVRFKAEGIEVLPVLLRAADQCLGKVNARMERDPAKDHGAGNAALRFIVHGLKQVGGKEAEAKLEEIARCKSRSVSFSAKTALRAMGKDTSTLPE